MITANVCGSIHIEVCYIPHPETRTMPQSLGAKAVSVRGCFPPHAMRLARAMLESGLYSEENITIKGVETTAFEMMYEILLALPESKETPLWAYGLVVEVSGKKDGRGWCAPVCVCPPRR